MSYLDMAHDAGYRGEEARQAREYEEAYHREGQRQEEAWIKTQCEDGGHAYYGDEERGPALTVGRCYCGSQIYEPRGESS